MASAKELFVQSPSMEVLETFRKDILMQIAQELQLEVKRPTCKHGTNNSRDARTPQPGELSMKSPLLPNLIWVKICAWYHLSMNRKLISTFNNFEKVAQNLKWPTDQWPLLLQIILKGKAQEAYTALPISECVDYNCVKNAILKARVSIRSILSKILK